MIRIKIRSLSIQSKSESSCVCTPTDHCRFKLNFIPNSSFWNESFLSFEVLHTKQRKYYIGLLIWLLLLAIFNTRENGQNTQILKLRYLCMIWWPLTLIRRAKHSYWQNFFNNEVQYSTCKRQRGASGWITFTILDKSPASANSKTMFSYKWNKCIQIMSGLMPALATQFEYNTMFSIFSPNLFSWKVEFLQW